MTITILLNLILCSALFVAVTAPLVWAILTTQRDEPVQVAKARPDDDLVLARRPQRPTTPPQPRHNGAKRRQASLIAHAVTLRRADQRRTRSGDWWQRPTTCSSSTPTGSSTPPDAISRRAKEVSRNYLPDSDLASFDRSLRTFRRPATNAIVSAGRRRPPSFCFGLGGAQSTRLQGRSLDRPAVWSLVSVLLGVGSGRAAARAGRDSTRSEASGAHPPPGSSGAPRETVSWWTALRLPAVSRADGLLLGCGPAEGPPVLAARRA